MQKYIDDCKQNSSLKSDLIFALDYFADDNYFRWDALRQEALKENGRAYSVYDKIERERVFFSIGTTDSVEHYLFYKPEGGTQYLLKKVTEIPSHYRIDAKTHEKVLLPAVPEIMSLSKLLTQFYTNLKLLFL